MDYNEFLERYIRKYEHLRWVFWPEKGFIVWRMGTGGNAELLHITSFKQGRGYGRELVGEMVRQLQENPPYYSVFGFSLSSRVYLKRVYQHLGFNITDDIIAPYKGGHSFIFYQDYEILKKSYLSL